MTSVLARFRRSFVPAALGLSGALVLAQGCGSPTPGPGAPEQASDDASVNLDLAEEIRIFDPERAASGYTLDLRHRRTPVLIDMNGRVVHSWPKARVKSRVRLLPDGSLLAIGLGRNVVEYAWDGSLTWEARLGGEIPHHDLIRLANGNTLVVTRAEGQRFDSLRELGRDGQSAWEWHASDHLSSFVTARPEDGDADHINSVQELPANRWFDAGDVRFRPGNLLISARNMDRIFVVDRVTGEVTWHFGDRLDRQHEAQMIPPGDAGEGKILVLSNGRRGLHDERKSTLLEIDPPSGEITWLYRADDFFTPIGSVLQPLANGNVLVTSYRGRRVFEVARGELTRGDDIVWQWVPPALPSRARRYAYDHTPQLAALAHPAEIAVEPPPGYRHVDRPVYRFTGEGGRTQRRIGDERLDVLRDPRACPRLFLPREAGVRVRFGLVPAPAEAAFAVRFALRLRPGDGDPRLLVEETLASDAAQTEHGRFVDLGRWPLRWVELCVETEVVRGEGAERERAYWAVPVLGTAEEFAAEKAPKADGSERSVELSEEEKQVRREHLKALGYVD